MAVNSISLSHSSDSAAVAKSASCVKWNDAASAYKSRTKTTTSKQMMFMNSSNLPKFAQLGSCKKVISHYNKKNQGCTTKNKVVKTTCIEKRFDKDATGHKLRRILGRGF